MSYITTKDELKDYIYRQLGSEIHTVEVTDANFEDIYNRSIKYYQEYSSETVIEENIILQLPNGVKEITVDERIAVINGVYKDRTGFDFAGFGTNLGYSGFTPLYDYLFTSGGTSISAVTTLKQEFKSIRELRNNILKYDFNEQTRLLRIFEDEQTSMFINVSSLVAMEELYDSEYFLLILERGMWKQWAVNTKKFLGSTIGNSVSLNTDYFEEKYKELDDRLKEIIENEEYDMLGILKITNSM